MHGFLYYSLKTDGEWATNEATSWFTNELEG